MGILYSEKQKKLVNLLSYEVLHLKKINNILHELLDDSSNISLYKETAETFFFDISRILREYWYLLCRRITEKYRYKTEYNLSLVYFCENFPISVEKNQKLKALADEAISFCKRYITIPTNSVITHLDTKTLLSNKIIGGFPLGEDLKFISVVEEFISILYEEVFEKRIAKNVDEEHDEVKNLLFTLRSAICLRKMLEEGNDIQKKVQIINYIQGNNNLDSK
jgi:hypothetical protein